MNLSPQPRTVATRYLLRGRIQFLAGMVSSVRFAYLKHFDSTIFEERSLFYITHITSVQSTR